MTTLSATGTQHADWCDTADHDDGTPDCASAAVTVAGVTAWVIGDRVVVDSMPDAAHLTPAEVTGLVGALECLRGHAADGSGAGVTPGHNDGD